MFYKFKHNQLPHYLTTMLFDAEKLHAYNTRSNPVLATPCSNLHNTEKCVWYHLPTLINDTDRNIIEKVDTHSYYGFGAYVKKTTIQDYQSVCTISDCYICQRQWLWYYFWLKLGNLSINIIFTSFDIMYWDIVMTHHSSLSIFHGKSLVNSLKWTPRILPRELAMGCPYPCWYL